MKLEQPSAHRLELLDGRGAQKWGGPWTLALALCVGALGAIGFITGSWTLLPLALIFAFVAVRLLRKPGTVRVVFDRAQGTVSLVRSRPRSGDGETTIPLEAVEKVVLEAQSPETVDQRGQRRIPLFSQWKLRVRPALLVNKRIVELTGAAFEKIEPASGIVRQIRVFLGHTDTDIIRDSIETQARYGDDVKAARHFARHVYDLDYFEADTMMERLRGAHGGGSTPEDREMEATEASASSRPRRRISYRREGIAGIVLAVVMLILFIWGGDLLTRLFGG